MQRNEAAYPGALVAERGAQGWATECVHPVPSAVLSPEEETSEMRHAHTYFLMFLIACLVLACERIACSIQSGGRAAW